MSFIKSKHRIIFFSIFLCFLSNCNLKEPSKTHGINYLDNRYKSLIVNKTNTNDQKLKEELEMEKKKAEKDKLDLQKKLNEKKQVKTNVIHFQYLPADINGNKVQVTTRLYYDDPLNLNPNKINGSDPINCYVTFSNRDDLSVIELGDRNTQPIVSKYHLETLNVNFNDIIKLKNEKCQF